MTVKFPGLIDIHVHLRDPGQTNKEDFLTGSKAAIKGGFTFIIDMPNNSVPTFTLEALEDKVKRSKEIALCDIGFYYGTDGTNLQTFAQASLHPSVFGLKVYCNETTGRYMVNDESILDQVFQSWQSSKPILAHAEGNMLPLVLALAEKHTRHLHICHVATSNDVEIIRIAKKRNPYLSAGVCPHHLFLSLKEEAMLGDLAYVKPSLCSPEDQEALWNGLFDGTIDLIESDHAPHTKEEKLKNPPVYGFPGLETTLPILLRAVDEGKITLEDLQKYLYDNPKKIFSIPTQEDTYIEFDPKSVYKIGEQSYETKSGWSPFDQWEVFGLPQTVVLRGKTLLTEGSFV